MKIIFFTKGNRNLPSSRTRAFLISDYLRRNGYESECYHVKTRPIWETSHARLSEFMRNFSILWSLKKKDVLFLHRTVYQTDFFLLVLARKFLLNRGYTFDFDDAIFLEKGNCATKTRIMIKYADIVIVGSHFLKEYAQQYNKNVYIITTILDTENTHKPYEPKHIRGKRDIIIGWTGTPVHLDNMKLLVYPLTRLVNEGYSIKLLLLGGGEKISNLFKDIKGLKLSVVPVLPWNEPREVVRFIQNFDIGVMPLQKTEWNKGKDAYKAKEFMACGVATIVSAWGENPYIVKNGVNGLLADNEEQWYQSLKKLIDNSIYREKIARGGRVYTETKCSFKVFIPKMLEIIRQYAQ